MRWNGRPPGADAAEAARGGGARKLRSPQKGVNRKSDGNFGVLLQKFWQRGSFASKPSLIELKQPRTGLSFLVTSGEVAHVSRNLNPPW
ncbi:MAG: hypothetical protein EAZ84_04550 [Verrucomicrobia bacterium]|nr:MAG: hypothetical protein EAZ84_04550 [Verrucomicrobiota bacterium]TAE88912.1 MAG: hypothetical protein EAZ82_02435 [Verrucomicrobiota bacterium]